MKVSRKVIESILNFSIFGNVNEERKRMEAMTRKQEKTYLGGSFYNVNIN